MYKLLIVEDEDLLRDALLCAVDWAGEGFEAMAAEDGEKALAVALAFCPDIVITDIRMPFMDGLALCAHLRERMPQAVVAILSGHDEFSYAQRAMQLGAEAYILKPVCPPELLQSVKRLCLTVDARRSQREREQRLQSQLRRSLPILRSRLLNQLTQEALDEQAVREAMEVAGVRLSGASFTLCLIDCELPATQSAREALSLRYAALNLIQTEVNTDGEAFELYSGEMALLYRARTQDQARERTYVTWLLEEILRALDEQLDIAATAAAGIAVAHLYEVPASFQSACRSLERRMLGGDYRVYDAQTLPTEPAEYPFEPLRALLNRFETQCQAEFEQELIRFFDGLCASELSREALRVVMIDLVNGGCRCVCGFPPTQELYQNLFECRTLLEYRALVLTHFAHLYRVRSAQKAASPDPLIGQILEYLQSHYGEAALSQGEVAKSVFVSPTYLSVLFKRKLGTTFMDYLIALRLDKAKALLREGYLRTYEVAQRVGYGDPQYFSSCFKKYTGFTPTEYRAREAGAP